MTFTRKARGSRDDQTWLTRMSAVEYDERASQRLEIMRRDDVAMEGALYLAEELALGLTEEQLMMQHEQLRARFCC